MFTLKAKHWQAFLIVSIACLMMNFTVKDNLFATSMVYVVGVTMYISWFAILGNTLANFKPKDADYSRSWFLLDIFVVLLGYCAVAVLTDTNSFQAEGLAALPVFYLFFAMVHILWFPAATLVAIEKNRKPEFGFYFGTMLLMLFWPLGVWFVQPRLNRVFAERAANPTDFHY